MTNSQCHVCRGSIIGALPELECLVNLQVHEYSTHAASSLLVAALNEGRDVIFDGTMSWEPFVLQTMAMVRDIHNR